MKLFDRRPLSLILCIMLGGFCLFIRFEPLVSLLSGVAFVAVFCLTFVFKHLFMGRDVIVKVSLIALTISIFLASLWSYIYFPRNYYGEEVTVEGLVTYSEHTDEMSSTVVIKTDKINGKRDSHKLLIKGYKDELSGINAKDRLTCTLVIDSLDSYSREFKSYYISCGYSARATEISDVNILSHDNRTLSLYFLDIRDSVSDRFREISDYETGGFLAALLLGDRDAIDENTELSFIRTGISHILALSGAHLVIVSFAVMSILSLFKLNKKAKTAINCIFILAYMLLTGMSACVTRAGVMLIVTSLLFLLSRKGDTITSLIISVCIILLFQPYSAFDISLWLSAFATLGLVFLSFAFSAFEKKKRPVVIRILLWLLVASLATVFAVSASYLFCLFNFDSFSTMSVIATLIFSPITELIIYIAGIGLVLGDIISFNPLLIWLTDSLKSLCDILASPTLSLISMDYLLVKILIILLCVAFFYFLVLGGKSTAKTSIIVITSLFLAVNLSGIALQAANLAKEEVIYSPTDSCDAFLIKSDSAVSVILTSDSKYDAYSVLDLLQDERITAVDNLFVTNYSEDIYDLAGNIFNSLLVRHLILPTPKSSAELQMASWLGDTLSQYTTDLAFISDGDRIMLGECELHLFSHNMYNSLLPVGAVFSITDGEGITCFISADLLNYLGTEAMATAKGSDRLIVGGAGADNKTTFRLYSENAKEIIISEKLIVPEDIKEYYEKRGVPIKTIETP